MTESARWARQSQAPGQRVYCTQGHQPGEHDASCCPPAEPDNPELRLLRAIYGLCSLCDRTDDHEHSDEEILAHGMVPYQEDT